MDTKIRISEGAGQVQAFEGEEQVGLIDFGLEGDVMSVNHTRTYPGHEGKGVAGVMMAAANEYAIKNQFKVMPICSYAWAWYQRHPEFCGVLDEKAGEGVSCPVVVDGAANSGSCNRQEGGEKIGGRKPDGNERGGSLARKIGLGIVAVVFVVLLVFVLVHREESEPLDEKWHVEIRDDVILERAMYIFRNLPDHEDLDSVDKSVFSASFLEVLQEASIREKEDMERGYLFDRHVYWYRAQDEGPDDGLVELSVSSSDESDAYVTVKYRNFEVQEHSMKLVFENGVWLCDNWDSMKEELGEELKGSW